MSKKQSCVYIEPHFTPFPHAKPSLNVPQERQSRESELFHPATAITTISLHATIHRPLRDASCARETSHPLHRCLRQLLPQHHLPPRDRTRCLRSHSQDRLPRVDWLQERIAQRVESLCGGGLRSWAWTSGEGGGCGNHDEHMAAGRGGTAASVGNLLGFPKSVSGVRSRS